MAISESPFLGDISVDHYTEIGSSHLVCQDYALSGIYKGVPYAIVSDGCSGADFSEIGAQTLCFSAKAALEEYIDTASDFDLPTPDLEKLLKEVIYERALKTIQCNALPESCLQATLMIAFIYNEKLHTLVWGDGLIIIKRIEHSTKEKEMVVEEIEYPSNAPFYLFANKELYEKYVADKRKLVRYTFGKDRPYYEMGQGDKPKGGERPVYEPLHETEPAEFVISITLSSDGLKSYKDKRPILPWDVAKKVTNYASSCESFVRRCMSFLKKKNVKEGITHYDDIATATILLGGKHGEKKDCEKTKS